MAVDPVIQSLMDLIEPPEDGHRAGGTSNFGADRSTGTTPHVGFDMSRGRGVLPHGRVTSPVYGKIKKIDPALGRIVIEEWDDPVHKRPTGYDVEILHTQTQSLKEGDNVAPKQQIGTQGDVGAPGAFHAHIQVLHGDRAPINPLRHLFEYHNPGEPIPPLRQFQPERLPPRDQGGSAPQPANQRQPAPDRASSNPLAGETPSQFPSGTAIPGAEGPTSIGGPAGPRPLVSPGRSRLLAPIGPAPAVDPMLPPPHFAPDAPRSPGPSAVPGLFRSDASGGPRAAPVASAMNAPPRQSSSPAFPPVRFPLEVLLASDRGRALDQWASSSPRRDASRPTRDDATGLPGLIAAVAGRDPSNPDQPPVGGLLGMIQDYMRNNGY
jgi:hypothetical protein